MWISRKQWAKTTRFLIAADLFACVVAWFIMVWEVESVLVSGPLLSLMGIATMVSAGFLGFRPGMKIGAAHLGICVLFFGLVNLLEWGPSDARLPFTIMGLIYVLVLLLVTQQAWGRIPPAFAPDECQGCGYKLYGLTEPRCPECGRAFEPALLATLLAPAGKRGGQA